MAASRKVMKWWMEYENSHGYCGRSGPFSTRSKADQHVQREINALWWFLQSGLMSGEQWAAARSYLHISCGPDRAWEPEGR